LFEKPLCLAETLLIIVSIAMLMGSVFFPFPFKVFGYEFIPPQLRISPTVGIILGLILPLVLPMISAQIGKAMSR
jgi:hypothetical protein